MNALFPPPGQTLSLNLNGPAGTLNAVLAMPLTSPPIGIAVTCHPHPLYGGNMTNKVVYALVSTAQKRGFATLRFDFRGVGKSQGSFDEGRGETDDCLAAVAWMRERFPGLALLLAGFSFGAHVSLRAAAAAKASLLFSVAPPFRYFENTPKPPHPGCPWTVIHSTDDDVVPYEDTRRALMSYQPPPMLTPVEGCGHFFHGRLNDVALHLGGALDRHWPRA